MSNSKVKYNFDWNNRIYMNLGRNKITKKKIKSRFVKAFYKVRKNHLQSIVHGLGLKPGDVIQTCRDRFNHVITKIEVDMLDLVKPNYEMVYDIDFHTGESIHSWNNCCAPALSVEQIEKYYYDFISVNRVRTFEKSALYSWYGDTEESHKKFEEIKEWEAKILNRIENGLPICDSRGICLPELECVTQIYS